MISESVLVEVADRIATVTLNRPEARNALNRATQYGLWDAVAAADRDPDVDVVVVTGADPAFCAGIDLKEAGGEVPPSAADRDPGPDGPGRGGPGRDASGMHRFLPVTGKPVIGAINGPAVTGGLEVALQCTFLIASERAVFADTHGRVGVMPGGGMTVVLARTVGLRKAIEMSLTGNFMAAPEALALGLVNHVVPHEELMPAARRLAGDIASCDQRSVATLLAHYRRLDRAASLDEAHLLEGLMAETWQPGTSLVRGRRADVTARGRAQARGGVAGQDG
ncbi:MAG TPA: enoyl-CoA hydratase [Trebonia sp.]|nr:enoyl-CoA hydratase [Trebonia sp.]